MEIRKFIWSIFLLIVGVILFLTEYYKWALIFIFSGFLGIILVIYMSKGKVEILSKKWTNIYILIMIFSLIIYSFIFEWRWRPIDIILCGIVLIALYLYLRFFALKIGRKLIG